MSKELIVSTGKHETRVAILEDDQLVEIFHEREKEYSLAGSIHKGRVTRVLPGMQSAFVDIGLERDAFLYVSDFFEDNDEYDAVVSTVEEKILKMEKDGGQEIGDRPAGVAPERADRGERSDRNDRPERGDRPERSGRNDRSDRGGRPERADRPERGDRPERSAAAPENREVTAPEAPAATDATAAPAAESRPDRNAGGGRGGDRGADNGRGRRGRRRRGGRAPGGLPDSKFFTPGAAEDEEPEGAPVVEAQVVNVRTEEIFSGRHGSGRHSESVAPVHHPPVMPIRDGDEFTLLPGESLAKYVLPGESLAKYAVEDVREDEEEFSGQPVEESAATLEAEVDDLVHQAVSEQAVSEVEVAEALPVEAVAEAPVPVVEAVPAAELLPEPAALAAAENEGMHEPLPETDEAGSVETDGETSDDASPDEDAEISGEAEGGEGEEAAAVDHEGPEPARIPTSLTAALREQGHRYPHRVSRRTRRKMRGPGDERSEKHGNRGNERGPDRANESSEKQVAEHQSHPEAQQTGNDAAVVEAVAAETREERRPDQRNERGRSERSERPERSGERNERPERTDRERVERPDRERPVLPSISDLLKEGQEIIVQIAKEPLGQKGARITSHIALPGRFVVYMPTVDHAGVSRKIPSDEERHRLKRVVQTHRQGIPGGFICRTAAEGKSEEELKSDMHFLYNLWLDMRQKAEKRPAPLLLHHDLDLVQRILRDQLTTSFKTIWVDNEELYESILRFAQRFQPALVGRVKLYTRTNPIFDEFGITNELEKALRPKVWLKSGGYIVINQTEALVAIDINTGKYVGKSNRLEDTIVKINTDAIKEIVRQIRLRDLGGIIVVDFIDMDERKNRQKVMLSLEESMRADRAPYKILQFNDFGLVAITRKRVKQSLERTLCSPCPYCEGAGYIKSVQTVITEILQEAQRMKKALEDEHNNIMLRVNPEVAKVLKSNHNQFLQELEEILGKSVLVKSDPLLHQTKFDLA